MLVDDSNDSPHVTVRTTVRKELSAAQIGSLKPLSPGQVHTVAPNGFTYFSESRKRVRFSELVRVREVPCLKDYTKNHLREIYHTRRELQMIKKRLHRECKVLQNDDLLDDDEEVCVRGLEGEMQKGRIDRRRRQQLGRAAVSEEQAYQRERGHLDREFIANLYAIKTCDAMQLAMERANSDSKEAKEYLSSSFSKQ